MNGNGCKLVKCVKMVGSAYQLVKCMEMSGYGSKWFQTAKMYENGIKLV